MLGEIFSRANRIWNESPDAYFILIKTLLYQRTLKTEFNFCQMKITKLDKVSPTKYPLIFFDDFSL